MTENNKLDNAKILMDNGSYDEALQILIPLKNLKKSTKFDELKFLFISNCFLEKNEEAKSIYWAKKLKKINPRNEFASQIIYISLVKLKKFDEALKEIINFLNKYPANLYLITLEELLLEIEKGNITSKSEIIEIKKLAKSNNVKL